MAAIRVSEAQAGAHDDLGILSSHRDDSHATLPTYHAFGQTMRSLIVDDDTRAPLLGPVFSTFQVYAEIVSSCHFLRRSSTQMRVHDLVAIDGSLDASHVCHLVEFARSSSGLPILCYASGHWSDPERIRALDVGADVLVDATLHRTRSIAAQMRALVRLRSGAGVAPIHRLRIGTAELDVTTGTIVANGHSKRLTRNELTIIIRLTCDTPNVVTYYELYRSLGMNVTICQSRAIKQAILRLRRKLGSSADQIEVVEGIGYRLICEVRPQQHALR